MFWGARGTEEKVGDIFTSLILLMCRGGCWIIWGICCMVGWEEEICWLRVWIWFWSNWTCCCRSMSCWLSELLCSGIVGGDWKEIGGLLLLLKGGWERWAEGSESEQEEGEEGEEQEFVGDEVHDERGDGGALTWGGGEGIEKEGEEVMIGEDTDTEEKSLRSSYWSENSHKRRIRPSMKWQAFVSFDVSFKHKYNTIRGSISLENLLQRM